MQDSCEAQLDLAWKVVQQYRAEIASRPDLVADGFCQGVWFEENYETLRQSIKASPKRTRDRCKPRLSRYPVAFT
jgi:hypothetical protein